jgi:glycosyltransferase involved in cell wall biosynthesis
MKLLYDHQAFSMQRVGGISRYFAELIRLLRLRPDVTVECGVFRSRNEHYLEVIAEQRLRAPSWASGRRGAEALRLLNSARSIWKLTAQRPDLFHPTYYNPSFLPFVGRTPFVVTVFDMIHELMADDLPRSEAGLSGRKRLLTGAASRVIAISHTTKTDLVRLFGIPETKISVVHLAHSLDLTRTPVSDVALPGSYVLFVGNRLWYKNFTLFLGAIAPVLSRHPSLKLVCVGGGEFTAAEHREFGIHAIAERVVQISVNDRDLPAVYAGAKLFVFPSRYEGFGIPLLEAFACGCPVAASKTSCFPEICGDAAAFFDPDDAESMTAAMESILDDPALADELRAKGTIRCAQFSWQQTADRTFEVYSGIS